LQKRQPALAPALARRLARAYGSRVERVLARPLGAEVAPGLHEAELQYLCEEEWARSGDDVLWRRSKLGLHYDEAQRRQVTDWMAAWTARHAEAACS